jgi:glycosyltransferase involved in cell wall biosynthesis
MPMRVLYCALDQTVPGTVGGATHVRAVAEGLARLGHEVHVLTRRGPGGFPPTPDNAAGRVWWHALSAPGARPHLRLLRATSVTAAARRVRPDAVIERYHNFGGEGVLAARRVDALAVLEVNAPIVDHPGSRKASLDRALVIEPMRRWRERICRWSDLIVTPSARILPASVPTSRVLEIEWGADTDRFHPAVGGPVPFERRSSETVATFAGAFRAWHGAHHLADAVARLEAQGVGGLHVVFVGNGPELARTREAAARLTRATFTGALPYESMPSCLAAADVGVAPFDVVAHAPLQVDFYWSPLKVFEYMATGLPVVAPRIPRLARLVADGREGLLYDPSDPDGLSGALRASLDANLRRTMGAAARARAERDYSWHAHCERLAGAIACLIATRRPR